MSYVSDWGEWEEGAARARAQNPLCDMSATCPAPDGAQPNGQAHGHLIGCRRNRIRLGLIDENGRLIRREATDA